MAAHYCLGSWDAVCLQVERIVSPKVAQVLSVAMTQADRAVCSVQVWWQTIRYPHLLRMPRFETLSQSGETQKEKTPLQDKSIVGLGHESAAMPQYHSDHTLTTDGIPCVQSHTSSCPRLLEKTFTQYVITPLVWHLPEKVPEKTPGA